MHPKMGILWQFLYFFLILIKWIDIYTQKLTITNGVFSHQQNFSNAGVVT